ncbi:O-antigen ligase family protein [Konateibacter massiliensis]|uniref:O-antigen ligase family protein n=1 Tax=Konateibacter massiliensis TaxID=2002841 RepID=UPI000C15B4D1|nr:O-antigen ligase family protein [Konateibacter massiliensis]
MENNKKKIHIKIDDILIYLTVGILPLLVRLIIVNTNLTQFPWFPNMEKTGDFFLYIKSIVFIFLVIGMSIIMLDRHLIQRKKIKFSRIFFALISYAVLIILSTILSKNQYFSLHGLFEQYESIWILLGYCITVCYCYTVVSTEKQIKNILNIVYIAAAVLGILGVLQLFQLDFFGTKFGKFLIIPTILKEYRDTVIFNFSSTSFNRVYMTLYNPNYVGVYLCMVFPLVLVGLFNSKSKRTKILLFILTGILTINLIGCGSKTALVVLPMLLFISLCIFRRRIIKYKKFLRLGLVVLIATFGIFQYATDGIYIYRLQNSLSIIRQEYKLTKIEPRKNDVKIIYGEDELYILSEYTENQTLSLQIKDGNQNELLLNEKTEEDGYYKLQDKKYSKLSFLSYEKDGIKYIAFQCNSLKWRFTDALENGYQYITINGKTDKMVNAPALFGGYEKMITFRGYIWGRTIPLLKNYFFYGAGPDQFAIVFPQNDYVMRSNMSYGFFTETLTKPHSLYLQIAVQTGVLSLICFLVFVGNYLSTSFKLLIYKKEYNSLDLVGISIFLAIIGYLLCGITNDSCIAVAPIFWVLLGVGMAVNRILKPSA